MPCLPLFNFRIGVSFVKSDFRLQFIKRLHLKKMTDKAIISFNQIPHGAR